MLKNAGLNEIATRFGFVGPPLRGFRVSQSAFFRVRNFCTIGNVKTFTQEAVSVEFQLSTSPRLIKWAVALGLLGAVLAVAAKNMVVDLDLYHEMALYRQMESEGRMPRTDAFAYTPTLDLVVHHEWATGAVLYLATVKTGWGATGLVAIKYFLTFAVCIGCFVYCRRHSASLAVFALLAPIALNVGGWMAFNNVRAQLFTLFFLVVLFFLLDLDRKGKRWWIAIWFPVFVVWANMHGGVVSGMGILGVYCLTRLVESWQATKSVTATFKAVAHLVAVGLMTLVLLIVNPYGWEYIPYLIRAVRMERPLILEWMPIWEIKLPILYGLSLLIAAYGIWCKGKESLFETLAIILTAYLAAKHYRHGSLYAVTWACFVPPMIQPTQIGESIEGLFKKYQPQIAVIAIAIGLVAVGYSINMKFWKLQVPSANLTPSSPHSYFPVGPVEYLREQNFEGNLFTPFSVGAYVEWKLYPDVKISLDSRYEVAFPDGALAENMDFYAGKEGWEAILTKYDTHALLTANAAPVDQKMLAACESESIAWKRVYRDQGFSIYMPKPRANSLHFVDRSGETIKGVFP